ncbi:hypothetical protein EX30DRAFT_20813 [Ascodesmis nigricans]|uniref:Ubiquitin-like-conjugating enzyme ATG10 n=1 Tax=Ascodesmis nigricans TaxID=341454 RepID=A0A4V3SJU0_9PEZI|nr:hypothetical protein EX30DRAFT_20813 [Ascodesmis nigricans]
MALPQFPALSPGDFANCAHAFAEHQEWVQKCLPDTRILQFRVRRMETVLGHNECGVTQFGGPNSWSTTDESPEQEVYLAMVSYGNQHNGKRPHTTKGDDSDILPHHHQEYSPDCEDDNDNDNDALPPPHKLPPPAPKSKTPMPQEIHIFRSPNYKVPVVYFRYSSDLATPDYLDVVSQAEHPLTGEIWWFIHPCNTLKAMEVMEAMVLGNLQPEEPLTTGQRAVEARYMLAWWGLVKDAVIGPLHQ